MVAQSLISGRAGGLDHPLSNNNFHVSSYNNAEHGTASIAKPAVKTITNNQVVKAQPVKQKFEPITGHRDIDKFIRYAYKNSQYCLTFGHKQKPFFLRHPPPTGYQNDEEEKIKTYQSFNMYQTFSINCLLSLSSAGNSTISIFLIFNIREPNRFPELTICDQRISKTPGILRRLGFEKMRAQWNIKDPYALCKLLNNLTEGILSLNQMEFEHKLQAILGEEIVCQYLQGQAISQSVAYLQQHALQNKYAPKGIEINLQQFDQNMKTFRHYINCGQLQDLKTLQLFNISFAIDVQDCQKQFILTIIFFGERFEMRMKPARNMASGDNGNKNQFTQNFFYNFMRSNGGYQSDPYTALKRKLQVIQKKIIAISESQKFRKLFLNKLLKSVYQYGILYDLDTKQGYKMSIAIKIKEKLAIMIIQLGDLFPNDTIQISIRKFLESNDDRYSAIFGLTGKRTYTYEANGVKVRDFSDMEMHQVQANDVLHFMRDLIIESDKAGYRQTNSFFGFR